MTPELEILLYSVLLAVFQLLVYAVFGTRDTGLTYTVGPRDVAPDGVSNVTGRLKRAFSNHLETLPWFAAVVIVTHLAGKSNASTVIAAWTYLAARVVYIPLYATGVSYLRSVAWGVATAAIVFIAWNALR